MQRNKEITLEQKMRYLREIESIHRLSKKVLPPKGKTWAQIADQHLRRALGAPVITGRESINVWKGRMHHGENEEVIKEHWMTAAPSWWMIIAMIGLILLR